MLLPRSSSLARALSTLSLAQNTRPVILDAACARLRPTSSPTAISVRHASHGTAGRANGPKNGPGKRLGAKKSGDEYVIPGNIIFRQRGTLWHPGENVGIGRDHTIFALESGYVKYYRNPRIDPKKRYIGIVFDKTQTLPTPLNAARRRRLNMVAAPRHDVPLVGNNSEAEGVAVEDMPIETTAQIPVSQTPTQPPTVSKAAAKEAKRRTASALPSPSSLSMMPGNHYSYRESNYSLGRAAERAGVDVKQFERGDRFLAWRKKGARKARNAERRSLGKKKGSQRAGKRVQA